MLGGGTPEQLLAANATRPQSHAQVSNDHPTAPTVQGAAEEGIDNPEGERTW
jgi:hypothetical protein